MVAGVHLSSDVSRSFQAFTNLLFLISGSELVLNSPEHVIAANKASFQNSYVSPLDGADLVNPWTMLGQFYYIG